jgi:hypothetical protein
MSPLVTTPPAGEGRDPGKSRTTGLNFITSSLAARAKAFCALGHFHIATGADRTLASAIRTLLSPKPK